MQQQIQAALSNSLIGDNKTLQQSNEKLSELAKMQGYCTSLMEIINDYSLGVPIKQAALIQLKNNIKAKWKPKNEKLELSAAEKNDIRNALLKAIIQCSKNHMLIKLYRQVLTTIIGYEYQTWIPVNDILALLKAGNDLAPVFHCIIAICTNFEFSVIDKQKLVFTEFLKEILPAVLHTVAANLTNSELVYLSLKILWKSVHYEISPQIKMLTNDWMELIYLTIEAVNPDLQAKLSEMQARNTPEFYYYHSKKWATRILMRFIQRHAKTYIVSKSNTENVEFSKFWYQTYGIKLCQNIVLHLSTPIPTTKKIRYYQLKIIQGVVNDKPELIAGDSKRFQYDLLLKYMVITPEDAALANDDVVEYMRVDDEVSSTHSNIKRVATDVWNSFMQLESKLDRDKNIYQPGPLFQENLNFMYEKLASENLTEKELGMYLFCENRLNINRVPEVKEKMPEIIEKFVVPELGNNFALVRSKALDMIHEYGREIKNPQIILKCMEGVYVSLVSQSSPPLVRIKAAIALNSLLSHSESKEYLKNYLQNILQVYLKLIEMYDLEQVVSALEYFISDFGECIGPYAIQLFSYLSNIFAKMFAKDIELSQNEDYGSDVELAASGCIKTMTQIIESPLQPQVRQQIEASVLDLCAFLLTNESYDYHEDMMYLLRTHLQKVEKISPPCWFYYQVLIYFIVGIPNEQWSQIENSPLPDQNKKILASVREGNNFEYLEYVVPILRNYLGKGCNMIIAQKPQFKINVVHLILYLVVQVYKKGATADVEGEVHLDSCSIMLVYLLETFPSDMTESALPGIWNVCKYNISKGQTLYLKKITCQLMCVMLWKHPIAFLEILHKENGLGILLKYMKTIAGLLEETQQRKRVILGICTFLTLVDKKFDVLSKLVPVLLRVLVRFVKKNCVSRILLNTKEQNLKSQLKSLADYDSDEQNYEEPDDDDEDDMWDEDYHDKHVSVLKRVNELAYFQETITKIKGESDQVMNLIVSNVDGQKLQILEGLLAKAINLPER